MTQDEIIEMARQADFEMDDSCDISPQILWYVYQTQLEAFAKLVAAKAIAELESQELKQITVKDFVHMVEGKEDLIGRPVCFAQWPNGNTHPSQRTEQKTSADDFFKMIADSNPKPFPPPQRTWIGLTDDEFNELYERYVPLTCYALLIEKVEAKLKEKNT